MADDGAENGDAFGASTEPGDFNGDGIADLAIGIRAEDVGTMGEAGAVEIVYGSSCGLQTNSGCGGLDSQFWTQDSTGVKDTADAADHLGSSLASGDFNGDGYDDIAAGADFEEYSGLTKAGAVSVLYGSPVGIQAGGPDGPDDQFWTQNSPGVKDKSESGDADAGHLPARRRLQSDGLQPAQDRRLQAGLYVLSQGARLRSRAQGRARISGRALCRDRAGRQGEGERRRF